MGLDPEEFIRLKMNIDDALLVGGGVGLPPIHLDNALAFALLIYCLTLQSTTIWRMYYEI